MSGREYAKTCARMSRALDLCVNKWAENMQGTEQSFGFIC